MYYVFVEDSGVFKECGLNMRNDVDYTWSKLDDSPFQGYHISRKNVLYCRFLVLNLYVVSESQ